MITIIYLVDEYGIAFKNKKDAAAFVRKNDYNEQIKCSIEKQLN